MFRVSSSCPTSAARSTGIPRESKRDETERVQVHFNDECNAKSYPDVRYSADVIELGEFESGAMQGNASMK